MSGQRKRLPVSRHSIWGFKNVNERRQYRAFLIEKQNGACVYCGGDVRQSAHLDHITPLSRGGRDDRLNTQMLCPECNMSKGAHTDEEYRARITKEMVEHHES